MTISHSLSLSAGATYLANPHESHKNAMKARMRPIREDEKRWPVWIAHALNVPALVGKSLTLRVCVFCSLLLAEELDGRE